MYKRKKVRLRAEPQPLAMSASVSDVLDEFYEDYATWESDRYWWWVQMVLLEPNELIVNDGEDNLYRMTFTITDNGAGNPPSVEFGEPVPIRLEAVDTTVDEEATEQVAARSGAVAAAVAGIASARGPERVAASYRSRGESRPNAKKEEEQVHSAIKKLRAKLGLEDSVSDEEVLAAAAARLEAEPEAEPEGEPEPEEEPEVELEAKPEGVVVAPETLKVLQEGAAAGVAARAEQLRLKREKLVDDAVKCGKIPPKSRASYLKQAEQNLAATEEFLEDLAENVIPVELRGASEAPVAAGASADLEAWTARHMPDVAARKSRIVGLAAEGRSNRVMTDAA